MSDGRRPELKVLFSVFSVTTHTSFLLVYVEQSKLVAGELVLEAKC